MENWSTDLPKLAHSGRAGNWIQVAWVPVSYFHHKTIFVFGEFLWTSWQKECARWLCWFPVFCCFGGFSAPFYFYLLSCAPYSGWELGQSNVNSWEELNTKTQGPLRYLHWIILWSPLGLGELLIANCLYWQVSFLSLISNYSLTGFDFEIFICYLELLAKWFM